MPKVVKHARRPEGQGYINYPYANSVNDAYTYMRLYHPYKGYSKNYIRAESITEEDAMSICVNKEYCIACGRNKKPEELKLLWVTTCSASARDVCRELDGFATSNLLGRWRIDNIFIKDVTQWFYAVNSKKVGDVMECCRINYKDESHPLKAVYEEEVDCSMEDIEYQQLRGRMHCGDYEHSVFIKGGTFEGLLSGLKLFKPFPTKQCDFLEFAQWSFEFKDYARNLVHARNNEINRRNHLNDQYYKFPIETYNTMFIQICLTCAREQSDPVAQNRRRNRLIRLMREQWHREILRTPPMRLVSAYNDLSIRCQ